MPNWKNAELRAAALIGGHRWPANLGKSVDVESSWAVGQVKEVQVLSLEALTTLAERAQADGEATGKSGFVFVRSHKGRGRHARPMLIVMTETVFAELQKASPSPEGA